MNMEEYITQNWETIRKKVRAVCKHHNNTDDLLQDLSISLLEKPIQYQMDLLDKNKVDHWFVSSASIQFKSSTSPYYYKYRKFLDNTTEIQDWNTQIDDEEEINKIELIREFIKEELKTYNVYTKILTTEHLIGGKSYSEISREYGLNRKYVSDTITPVKNEIIEKVKKQWNYYLS
jgi:DNA-directed RNA polymerase specialized sigma24 family protein